MNTARRIANNFKERSGVDERAWLGEFPLFTISDSGGTWGGGKHYGGKRSAGWLETDSAVFGAVRTVDTKPKEPGDEDIILGA
jgi:hypothetical protein